MHKMRAFLKISGQTHEQAARALNVSRSHFTKVVNGSASPSRKLIERIAAMTGGLVPVTAWFEAAE